MKKDFSQIFNKNHRNTQNRTLGKKRNKEGRSNKIDWLYRFGHNVSCYMKKRNTNEWDSVRCTKIL